MANIQTKKTLVVTQQGPVMGVTPTGQGLVIAIGNEGVEHMALMNPQEATQLGVNIIRLAQQVEMLQAAEAMQQPNPNRVPVPGSAIELVKGSNGRRG